MGRLRRNAPRLAAKLGFTGKSSAERKLPDDSGLKGYWYFYDTKESHAGTLALPRDRLSSFFLSSKCSTFYLHQRHSGDKTGRESVLRIERHRANKNYFDLTLSGGSYEYCIKQASYQRPRSTCDEKLPKIIELYHHLNLKTPLLLGVHSEKKKDPTIDRISGAPRPEEWMFEEFRKRRGENKVYGKAAEPVRKGGRSEKYLPPSAFGSARSSPDRGRLGETSSDQSSYYSSGSDSNV